MNTVICQINSKYIHSSLAAWYILAGIREYCKSDIQACVIEGTINEKSTDIATRIIDSRPDIVGFSCYIWNIRTVLEVSALVRSALPNIRIIFGGPEVSYSPEKYLPGHADFIVCGEGERPFAALVDAICLGENAECIPGVAYFDGDIRSSEPHTPTDIPPSPYVSEYFDSLGGRIAYLETSRGCPFSCAFCLSGKCGTVRFFPEKRSFDELLMLANSGTSTIKLVDRTFNADRARAIRFFDFISENYGNAIPDGVRIHFEISAVLLDDATLEAISRLPYGAVQFEVGIQSFNKQTLTAIGRSTDIEPTVNNTLRLLALGNVHVHTDLIAGLPFEDYKSFRESFNRAFDMRPHMLQLGFLKVLSGSPMGDDAYPYKCNFSPNAPYEVISTEYIDREELDTLRRIEDLHERIYNSGRFRRTFDYALSQTGLSPFDLYESLSHTMIYKPGCGLDRFTRELADALEKLCVSNRRALYDTIIIDRITTNSEGRIPEFLKCERSLTALIKRRLEKEAPELFSTGVKSVITYLESQKRGVYVRYDRPCDRITNEYTAVYVEA
ncbi:MAG: B12-binding domain-containing radical SAM protein [Clostridia bacterium]|nr:B12-binding domain-containing radical SAM protein [Clostridia bacterium]